jgi:hypothetical protein
VEFVLVLSLYASGRLPSYTEKMIKGGMRTDCVKIALVLTSYLVEEKLPLGLLLLLGVEIET